MVPNKMTNYFIRNGFVEKVSNKNPNVSGVESTGFDLLRWLKKMLTRINVQFYDKCCDTASIYAPVRYNKDTEVVEFFDGTEWTEVA